MGVCRPSKAWTPSHRDHLRPGDSPATGPIPRSSRPPHDRRAEPLGRPGTASGPSFVPAGRQGGKPPWAGPGTRELCLLCPISTFSKARVKHAHAEMPTLLGAAHPAGRCVCPGSPGIFAGPCWPRRLPGAHIHLAEAVPEPGAWVTPLPQALASLPFLLSQQSLARLGDSWALGQVWGAGNL